MDEISIRELRNSGGAVVDRVGRGESLVVTRDGRPVAELRPLPGRPVFAPALVERWAHLPSIDYDAFRRDVDGLFDFDL